VGSGEVKPFEGDLDDYQKYLLDMAKQRRESLSARNAVAKSSALSAETSATATASSSVKTTKSIANYSIQAGGEGHISSKKAADPIFKSKEHRQQEARERSALAEKTKPLKTRLKQLEDNIEALKIEQTQWHNKITQPVPSAELIKANKRLAAITSEIEESEWKWLEISERLEGLLTA
jgi:ATP-binding cassette, subfamily F, member 3